MGQARLEKKFPRRVLLVEDSSSDAKLFCKALEDASFAEFHIVPACRLSEAVSSLRSQTFDAIILDLFLPDSEGLSTLDEVLRNANRSPVLILTGLESEEIGVEAIRKGAEEYFLKSELTNKAIARSIFLAMERASMRNTSHESVSSSDLQVGSLTINLLEQKVKRGSNGEAVQISLTPLEFKILLLLARNPGIVLPRSKIVAEIWGPSQDSGQSISVRTLDKHVSSLKRKCSPALAQLENVYGVGYVLDKTDSGRDIS